MYTCYDIYRGQNKCVAEIVNVGHINMGQCYVPKF